MFLCYGFDVSGDGVKTPFNEGTMFVIPELLSTLMGMGAFGAAFGLYWFRKTMIKK